MSEGDLASWIVAGSFVSKAGPAHAYTVGLSYSTQDYQGGNPIALAAMRDGSRNAAEVFAFDRWRIAPWFELDYGARYAHYDYIQDNRLLSPRFGFTVEPIAGTRMSALVTQRMVVPGAEEFLPRAITGPALPPERTFAPVDGDFMRVERARGLDLLLEHQFGDAYVVGVRRFQQRVDDQLATIFRLAPAGSPESLGHYYVGTAGSFNASGWGLRVSSPPASRLRGVIDYSVARAEWTSHNAALDSMAPALVRPEVEDIHDITTSLETDIPETATRVYLLYRINTAFTRASNLSRPGLDARFDMQVNQALPFGVAGTKWEVLVGLRNLFRDAGDPASVYDELLVVRPPKRVIGGFLVRF
jgi:outer membrane receptor protein involved in Fe transport